MTHLIAHMKNDDAKFKTLLVPHDLSFCSNLVMVTGNEAFQEVNVNFADHTTHDFSIGNSFSRVNFHWEFSRGPDGCWRVDRLDWHDPSFNHWPRQDLH
eukprot:CAMPEP_0172617316 /NCGR_PEP_ID=MMETSP1068-20121228/70179_1 /TAXON_ID=35684 /ORGANISM="Pseudopedinella elastica, Strain CCMP716" /LENGTH=98 /DNA_ID=CAMNT_0013423055 /DNA_START=500 /DNA_END=796 /DNA_ORIENTATION=-